MNAARMLSTARRRAGLTQRELARRAGVPQPTISRIEHAAMSPTMDTLGPLIEACGMDLGLIERQGQGVERGQLWDGLRRSPAERLRYSVTASGNIAKMVRRAREVGR